MGQCPLKYAYIDNIQNLLYLKCLVSGFPTCFMSSVWSNNLLLLRRGSFLMVLSVTVLVTDSTCSHSSNVRTYFDTTSSFCSFSI